MLSTDTEKQGIGPKCRAHKQNRFSYSVLISYNTNDEQDYSVYRQAGVKNRREVKNKGRQIQ